MTAPNVNEKKPNTPRKKKGFQNRKRSPMNDQMASKLSELFKLSQSIETKQVDHRQQVSTRGLLPLRQDSVDGVDHINFFTNVQTELGALLTTENRLPFVFGPLNKEGVVFGDNFESMKCLWAFYRTSCLIDGFRTVQDFKIRKLYRVINEFPKQESIFAVMVMGYYCKMLAYPTLAEALVKNTLPLDYYSVHNGEKKRAAVSKLMINALYEVRRALKFKTLPRLESFLSRRDQEKAMNVLPVYRHGYIMNILLSPDTMKQSYFQAIESWSKEELSKLNIDLGNDRSYAHGNTGDTVDTEKTKKDAIWSRYSTHPEVKAAMDDEASKLNIPTSIPETDMQDLISADPSCDIPTTTTEPTEGSVDLAVQAVTADVVLGTVSLETDTTKPTEDSV